MVSRSGHIWEAGRGGPVRHVIGGGSKGGGGRRAGLGGESGRGWGAGRLGELDRFGMSAVHYAAAGGHTAALQLLLQHKAPSDLPDRDGDSPLHAAVKVTASLLSPPLHATDSPLNASLVHAFAPPLHAAVNVRRFPSCTSLTSSPPHAQAAVRAPHLVDAVARPCMRLSRSRTSLAP